MSLRDPFRMTHWLRIEKPEQFLFIMLAELGADAHVPNDRSRDARWKTIGSIVTAGTVLRKDSFALAVKRLRIMSGGLCLRGRLGCRLLRGRVLGQNDWNERDCNRAQTERKSEQVLRSHFIFLSRLGTGSDRQSLSPRCFCCQWKRTAANSW